MMTERPYQSQYIDGIIPAQSNLLISTMRSGKSFMLERIIDKHFAGKRVLILVGMRNIIIQLANYFDDHTFILAGKPHDDSKHIHLGTFQTFQRRDIDLASYDLIAIDEAHMRYNTPVVKQIRALKCTRLFMTGTPLKPNGTFLDKSIDNILEFTNMKQMIADGYLAPTRFISRYNLLADESAIGVRGGDYVDADVERILDKQAVVKQLVADAINNRWATEHKCILYVNSIVTANKVLAEFNDPFNVKVIHSKLTKQQLEDVTDWYDSCSNGIIINVRMLTIGYDSPTTDTILYLTPTKIISLFLQSVWRASTKHGDKVASVYDYSGTLSRINPYFNEWQKKKPGCKEQCEKLTNLMERYFCMASCTSEPPMTNCTGTIPYSLVDNPYVSNFTITKGEPCGESVPVHQMAFKSTEPSVGILRKWTKCKCGCVTYYDVKTLTEPSQMIELYSDESSTNTVMLLVNRELRLALAILDDPSQKKYKFMMSSDSSEIYKFCLKYFGNQPFSMISNRKSKLPNVALDEQLEYYVPLVNWEPSANQPIIRKIVKYRLVTLLDQFSLKQGMAYYMMKGVTKDNIKSVLNKLNDPTMNREKLIRFSKKLQGD